MEQSKNKSILLLKYQQEIRPILMKEFSIKNHHAVPKLIKISVNIGLGEALTNKNVIESATKQLAIITGQKAKVTVAKSSISTFKLRAGNPIGIMVTLRGRRMYDFLFKLIAVVLPRVRDFRGISAKSFDGRGNYTFGFTEQLIFPEISFDQIDKIRGLEVAIVTSAQDDKIALRLLELLGLPFAKGEKNG